VKNKLFITFLTFFPKTLWSRFLGWLVYANLPSFIVKPAMKWFSNRYQLNLNEAEFPLEHYENLGQLFTRKLKANTHTIDQTINTAVSPADGHVLNSGKIDQGRLIQCKGRDFHVADLLQNKAIAEQFLGGSWCTVYLSPRDYHRVHHPIEGQVTQTHYITGKLWPVNQAAVQEVSRLFCVNERTVTYTESPLGLVATIMVGATSVGHISLAYDADIHSNQGQSDLQKTYTPTITVNRADELGTFHLGSTAIVLFANPNVQLKALVDGQEIRLGTPIASLA
jgi:phosphatidylserine decarboxylase